MPLSEDARPPAGQLLEEARRQLRICNACRYCEGYCAVFPALEQRSLFSRGDIAHIAQLCHDCRACYQACMYTPPHEFAINLPPVLSAARVATSSDYVRVPCGRRAMGGWRGAFATLAVSLAAVAAVALVTGGPRQLLASRGTARSPYAIIPYPALLALLAVPTVFALAGMVRAAIRYWRDAVPAASAVKPAVIWRAATAAASLRYLKGGGEECYYPSDEAPSGARRHLHALLFGGLLLCLASTVSAAALQDLAGTMPPYPILSVPVLAGSAGGIGLAAGCCGLLWLKVRSSALTSFAEATAKDYGLLTALLFLAVSGLAVLLTRSTSAFGVVFLVHLAAVVMCFLAAPYSKLTHAVFRFLALVQHEAEVSHRQLDSRGA